MKVFDISAQRFSSKDIIKMNKVTLLGLLLVLCISTSITENHESASDHTLTLNLDYAARQGRPLRTSQFAVLWNGKTVKAIAPSNYRVTHLSLKLQAKAGKNVISFVGLGPSDGYGATITNVKLVRPYGCEDDNEDLIANGNFHKGHNLGSGWKIFKDAIEGWQGKDIEIGFGPIYNRGWKRGTYVCELDAAGNSNLHQSIYFDQSCGSDSEEESSSSEQSQEQSESSKLSLNFNYAARQNIPIRSSQLQVYWNNKKLGLITPSNYNVHHANYIVYAHKGINTLRFSGAGPSDGYGATISAVSLIQDNKNLIKNGNFDQPNVGHGWRIFSSIPHWTGGSIEVGYGRIYNHGWNANAHVVELDSTHNANVIQTLKFDDDFNLV